MTYQLAIRLKSGFTVNLSDVSTETYGYILKWINKKWPDLYFDFIDRQGVPITVTSPDNVDLIIKYTKKEEF